MMPVITFVLGCFMVFNGALAESMGEIITGLLMWNLSGIFLILTQQDILSRQLTVLYKLQVIEKALNEAFDDKK
jgi:hypothetical protein